MRKYGTEKTSLNTKTIRRVTTFHHKMYTYIVFNK